MEEKKVYTISDIAQELGVSKTTVSRAISGKGRIGKETRDKVRTFIEEHDYRPNVLAKGLAQSKTYNLGLVLPMDYGETDVPFFKESMNGICEVASANNYDILISMAAWQDVTQIRRMISNRKVDGVILSRSVSGSAIQKLLKEKKIPFVIMGPSEDPGVLCVDNHNQEACSELISLLLMKGIRRLALLGGNKYNLVNESRRKGFYDAYQVQNLTPEETLIFMDVDNYAKAKSALSYAMGAHIDGIVCMDDFIMNLVLGFLREEGIKVPEQLKLASMYDSIQLEHNTPTITSLHFDAKELGRHACIALLNLLGEDTREVMQPLGYQVILRESTK